ncbi:putative transposase OrfB [Thalassovita gelatinovora]|uniref:Putative transposase OrfB n=1 Tax=Thalassovita gelatinovora TaxID=53501 RepID=A0A0P1F6V5_THAGE|nr:putative transposase OrfB [Thalassovita gelatinovora]
MKYAFVAEHRPQYSVRRMCRCLNIHPSGFYAWIKNPLSHRAREDARQTRLLKDAWKDSGKVYGYRKLHDDLVEQGETSCPNRIARLARLAGVQAQIGYKRRPGTYGEKRAKVGDALRDDISWRCSDAVNSLPRKGYATCQRLPSPNCRIHRVFPLTRSLTSSEMARAS